MKISTKLIVILYTLYLLYLSFDFLKDIRNDFWQFNYAWNQEETLGSVENAEILELSHDYIELKGNLNNVPQNGFILKLTDNYNEYYFNFNNHKINDSIKRFRTGFWLMEKPPFKKINFNKIEIIDIPIKYDGSKKICTIVDSQLLWQEGRHFRKYLYEINQNLSFTGNKKDVYGFPYVGDVIFNSSELLKEKNIPKSDIYVIAIGTHEEKLKLSQTKSNIKRINNLILSKYKNAKIVWASIPFSNKPSKRKYLKKYNQILKEYSVNDNIYHFKELKARDIYFNTDGIHFKQPTYKIFAMKLSKFIESL